MAKARRTARKTKATPRARPTGADVTIPFKIIAGDCKPATASVDPAREALARKAAEYMQHWPMGVLIDAVAMFAEQAGQAQCGLVIPDLAMLKAAKDKK